MRSRKYCFTINNYNDDDESFLRDLDCKYLIYGKEIGESGTPHLQGFVYFKNARRFKAVAKLHKHWHIEITVGTIDQNIDYCSKDGNFIEIGDKPKQGKRTDIDNVKKLVANGAKIGEIYNEVKSFQALRFAQIGIYLHMEDRTEKPFVFWRYGPAGTGKTRYIFDNFDIDDIYVKDSTRWWDGYEQQKVILIDDFDGLWPFRDFLKLLDRYPYQGQVKGGYVKINSPYIYITCEFPPEYYWSGNELAQVTRRLTRNTEVGGNTKTPTIVSKIGICDINDIHY